jgi:hypothetical protein
MYDRNVDLLAELDTLCAAFERRGLDYAICGGVALAIHGVPRATKDIDVLARSADIDAIRETLRGIGFTLEALPMTFCSSGITVRRFTKPLEPEPLMVDVLFADDALSSVWDSRQIVTWERGRISVVSRDGLTTLKLAAGRPQDLVDVQRLQEVDRG